MIEGATTWCSLFCAGNEAIGELTIPLGDDADVSIPVCQECADEAQENPEESLARILGAVVE